MTMSSRNRTSCGVASARSSSSCALLLTVRTLDMTNRAQHVDLEFAAERLCGTLDYRHLLSTRPVDYLLDMFTAAYRTTRCTRRFTVLSSVCSGHSTHDVLHVAESGKDESVFVTASVSDVGATRGPETLARHQS